MKAITSRREVGGVVGDSMKVRALLEGRGLAAELDKGLRHDVFPSGVDGLTVVRHEALAARQAVLLALNGLGRTPFATSIFP